MTWKRNVSFLIKYLPFSQFKKRKINSIFEKKLTTYLITIPFSIFWEKDSIKNILEFLKHFSSRSIHKLFFWATLYVVYLFYNSLSVSNSIMVTHLSHKPASLFPKYILCKLFIINIIKCHESLSFYKVILADIIRSIHT